MCKRVLFLNSIVVVLGLVTNVFATEVHVKKGASGVCPYGGVWFSDIDSAYSICQPGDTIILYGNTDRITMYGSTVAFTSDDSIHDVTLMAYHNGARYHHIGIGYTELRYKTGWTFEGLVFYNEAYEGLHFTSTGMEPDNWHIKNCIFYTQNKGINCNNTTGSRAYNWTIENCTFFGTGDGAFGGSDGIRCKYYAYNWTIKDCIFQSIKHWDNTIWTGTAVSITTGDGTYCDYCSFYDNGRDVSGPDGADAWYGVNVTTNIQVQFVCTNYINGLFLYLETTNDSSILTGDSDGSYRGARPTPEPTTIALLGLGGLALLRRRC